MQPLTKDAILNFSVPDWADRLAQGKSIAPDIPLDHLQASRAVAIFDKLRLPDVPGQPTNKDATGDWLREIVRLLFGSIDETGQRRVAEIFACIPKKNNKTTGGAAIMLVALLMNERPRAEFIIIGPTQEVADIAFQQASGMIDADRLASVADGRNWSLADRFKVQDHIKTIEDRTNKAKLKIKTFDMKVATGGKFAGILLDELHLMSTMGDATRVIGQLRGGMSANPEAFLLMITTQSDIEPAGAFKAELDYARGVRDGRITGGVLCPLIWEFTEAMQMDPSRPWMDTKNWPMVMPNLGRSITIPRLLTTYKKAVEDGDAEVRRWASQHLNIQIGLALHDGRWRGADYWVLTKDPEQITLDSLFKRCDVITVGGDAGGLDDLMALAVLGRDRITKNWLLWVHAWVQDDVLKLRPEIAPRLRDFMEQGDLTLCTKEKPTQDVLEFCDIVERCFKSGLLPERNGIGLDPAGIVAIVDELARRKIYTANADQEQKGPITGIKQTAAQLAPAIWGIERKLKDGTFWHAGQPIMSWSVSNAKTEQRGNAVLITKQTAGKAKIDCVAAMINAGLLMALNPEARPNMDEYFKNLAKAPK